MLKRFVTKVKRIAVGVVSTAIAIVGAIIPMTANAAVTAPTMPSSDSVFTDMLSMFGTAGTYALLVIGAAVALGLIVILAMYIWRLLKKWLSSAK